MTRQSNKRGTEFEQKVKYLLEDIKGKYPNRVKLTYQPRIKLYNQEIVIPDFEFKCDLGYKTDVHLIECQSRNKSSKQIIHKIRHIKSLSNRNKFIFVFEDDNYLSKTVERSLTADGVMYFTFEKFVRFIRKLSKTLLALNIQDDKFLDWESDVDYSPLTEKDMKNLKNRKS